MPVSKRGEVCVPYAPGQMSLSGASNVVNQALVAAVGEEKMAEGHLLGPLSMQQSSHHLAYVSVMQAS